MEVYEAFMNEKKHAAFTGMNAKIDAKPGGKFETCNKHNWGYTLELIPGNRIVQAWTHIDFPGEFFTIVDIELLETESGTRINFNHLGIPHESDGWLTEGWHRVYWNRMAQYFEAKNKRSQKTHKA